LALSATASRKSFSAKARKDRAVGVGDDETGGVWMSWWLESPAAVDDAYKLALEHGMTVTMPPTDEPWNVREFHLRHTDGHTFRVSAGLEEE